MSFRVMRDIGRTYLNIVINGKACKYMYKNVLCSSSSPDKSVEG